MVTSRVTWNAPDGGSFTFEYEIEQHYEASSVKIVDGIIYSNTEADTSSTETKKKQKSEKKVGYLNGYLIRRRNASFHSDGDMVCEELHEFTISLFDSKGNECTAPDDSALARANISASQGGMLLIEKMEIQHCHRGKDMGIHFLHELLALTSIKNSVGLVVMKPWTLNCMAYEDNRTKMEEMRKNKSDSERNDIARSDTIKLRRQYSRMGFKAVQDSPQYADSWFLPMDLYKSRSKDDISSTWMSKEEAASLEIPMKPKKHFDSEKDKELKDLLHSKLFASSSPYAMYNIPIPAESRLTESIKAEISKLIDEGASLKDINALHMAAAHYKSRDLFDYLIDEHKMEIEAFDGTGSYPLHVAACLSNTEAVQILLSKGAQKKAKNKDGKTPRQVLVEQERNMSSFHSMLGIGGTSSNHQLKALLK